MDTLDLAVSRIPQARCDTCGPAAVSMILGKLGVSPPNQASLMNEIGPPVGGLISPPAGMAATLNAHLSTTGPTFVARTSADPLEGCRSLVGAVLGDKTPAAALIDDCIHWVTISGATFEGSLATGIRLGGFIIDDPEDACLDCQNLASDLLIHGFVIGCTLGQPSPAILVWSNIKDWLQTHWKDGCSHAGPGQVPRFATVVPQRDISAFEVEPVFQELVEPGLISAEQAREFADRGIQFFGLDRWSSFASSLDGEWGRVVKSRDLKGGLYYLLERRRFEGTTALFRIDAKNGELLGARSYARPERHVFPAPDLLNELLQKNPKIVAGEKLLRVDPDEPLVWAPSLRSLSPYRPSFVVQGDDKRRFLVNSDGKITNSV